MVPVSLNNSAARVADGKSEMESMCKGRVQHSHASTGSAVEE